MNITPHLQVLSNENIKKVHKDSLIILEKAGIRVDSPEAMSIFSRSELVKTDSGKVFIRPELVEQAINSAPEEIKVYNKKGEEAFLPGSSNEGPLFGVGVTNPNFQDPVSGDIMPFKRLHTRYAARLGEIIDAYDMISTPGVPTDVPASDLDLYNLADMYAYTDKPLVILLLEDDIMETGLKLVSEIHGNISEKPFILPYVNPVTPLILNESTTSKMICSIENGLPLVF